MSNLFANAAKDLEGAEKEKDVLGGRRKLFETDAYDAIIDVAYLTKSSGGATAMNFNFKVGDQIHREQIWFTKKTGELFYVKDGKKYPLPGYSMVNAVCKLAIGKELSELVFEPKLVKIYNFELKKEVPTEVQVAVELKDAAINLGIEKILENKQAKDQAGVYQAIADTREVNEVTRVFHPVSGLTANEYDEQKPAEFKGKWLAEFKGKTRDKTDKNLKAAPTAAASTTVAGAAKTQGSLFGNAGG